MLITSLTVPSGFPRSLHVTSLSARLVWISWSPLPQNEQNGLITGYVVTITNVNANELSTIEVTGHNSTSIDTLPYTSYMVTVAARTSVGVGPPSMGIAIETPEDGMTLSLYLCRMHVCENMIKHCLHAINYKSKIL